MEGGEEDSQGQRVSRLTTSVCVLLTAGALLVVSAPTTKAADGQGQGFGWNDPGGVNIGAQDGHGQPGGRGSRSDPRGGGSGSSTSGSTTCTAHGVTGPISSKVVPDNIVEGWYTGGHAPSWAHGYDSPGTFYYIYCGGVYYDVEYI